MVVGGQCLRTARPLHVDDVAVYNVDVRFFQPCMPSSSGYRRGPRFGCGTGVSARPAVIGTGFTTGCRKSFVASDNGGNPLAITDQPSKIRDVDSIYDEPVPLFADSTIKLLS